MEAYVIVHRPHIKWEGDEKEEEEYYVGMGRSAAWFASPLVTGERRRSLGRFTSALTGGAVSSRHASIDGYSKTNSQSNITVS